MNASKQFLIFNNSLGNVNQHLIPSKIFRTIKRNDYGNVTKLERRLQNLGEKDQNEKLGINDIKSYLRGQNPDTNNRGMFGRDEQVNQMRDYFQKDKSKQDDIQRRSYMKNQQDEIDQMKDIKKEKHVMRMSKDQNEQDMMEMLKELENKKERELRAQIEKEEIQRNLKSLDKNQLTALERERKKELQKLSVERENLRAREQQMMDEVKKMESQLVDQERFYRKQNDEGYKDPDQNFANNNIRQKELEYAKERGQKIVDIKSQRDKLEKERQRILDDLEKVKSGNIQGFRKNDAARFVGDQIHSSSKGFDNLDKYQGIEPSLKDKLVNDQVKVNYLREQQRKTMEEMYPEIDDLDVLQKQMNNKNYADEAGQLANEYDGRTTPNKPLYLGTIRQQLENQAAAPSSHKPNNNYNYNQEQYETGLPDHVPQGEGKKKLINNIQNLKDDYLSKGGEDEDFINKVSNLENFLLFKKKLPQKEAKGPEEMHQYQNQNQNPNQYQQPQYNAQQEMNTYQGYPPPYPPQYPSGPLGMPPPINGPYPPPNQEDPMLSQMQNMLQQQEIENKKLKDMLEGIGNNNDYDNVINQTTNELEQLKNQLNPGGIAENEEDENLPEDFVFRQNEFRCEDLEVEERALMNLAAQEYDALRIISSLPESSEMYKYKMNQYKEISTMRAEVEKVLQEQRLEKIRRDFEKQKYEDERRFKHEKWLEDQKRSILEAKLQNAAKANQQQEYDQPMMMPGTQQSYPGSRRTSQHQPENQQNPMTSQSQIQTPKSSKQRQQTMNYDPQVGFLLCVDLLFNVPREYKQVRLVYSIFQDKKSLIEPRQLEIKQPESDYNDPNYNKVFFDSTQLLKHVKQNPNANLIIELQVPDPYKNNKFSSLGWTILNVFDQQNNLNKGRWRLPIYKPPTVLDLNIKSLHKLTPLQQLVSCIRIAMPKDEIFDFQPDDRTSQNQYNLPFVHDVRRNTSQQQQPNQMKSSLKSNRSKQKPQPMPNRDLEQPDQIQDRDPNYESSGIQILIHFIRNLKNFFKVKVQATLYEGINVVKQDNYQDCNWVTKTIDKNNQQIAPKGSKVEIGMDGQIQVIKPRTETQAREFGQNDYGVQGLDELILSIQQDVEWQKDLYNMIWDHNIKDNLFLLLQVFIVSSEQPNNYNQGSQSKQSYEAYGYTVIPVNNEDGTLRYGTYEQPIYQMPINLLKQDPNQMLPASIKFSIVQPKPKPLSVKNQLPSRKPETGASSQSEQFIPNFEKQWTPTEHFDQGDGIDIYIDWARFLPDNTMFSRVLVRCIDANLKSPTQIQRGFPSFEFSTARSPFYGFKYEVRGQQLNPTLLLFVSFETIDRSNGEPRFAGHSFFPLFMDSQSRLPITDPGARSYTLHKGFYQMPVYCQHPNNNTPFTYENFVYLERIPTASMLIRIYKAPKDSDGTVLSLDNVKPEEWSDKNVLISAPVYKDGIYNTQYYITTPLESKLYQIRKLSKDPEISKVLDFLLQMFNRHSNIGDDQKLELADKIINIQPDSPMIDMNYFSQYNSEIGFRVGVEAIHNNTEKAFFGVIMSICPSAEFYNPQRQGPPSDSVTYTSVDWTSNNYTIKFNEGQFMIQNIEPSQGASLIFDIKKYLPGKKKFEDYGFSIIPLFSILQQGLGMSTSTEYYINSGIYSLPVFKGFVDQQILNSLKQSKSAFDTIQQMQHSGKIKPMVPTSIIVKIVDNQREKHFENGFEKIPPRTRFLPKELLNKLVYQPGAAPPKQAVALQTLVPKGESIQSFQQFLTDYFHTQYKL